MANFRKIKSATLGENNYMSNNNEIKPDCQIHVMPPAISDQDITALFNGVLNVVKKKFELETKANIINLNSNIEKLLKELNEKKAECIRLKNEILFLQNQLNDKQFK